MTEAIHLKIFWLFFMAAISIPLALFALRRPLGWLQVWLLAAFALPIGGYFLILVMQIWHGSLSSVGDAGIMLGGRKRQVIEWNVVESVAIFDSYFLVKTPRQFYRVFTNVKSRKDWLDTMDRCLSASSSSMKPALMFEDSRIRLALVMFCSNLTLSLLYSRFIAAGLDLADRIPCPRAQALAFSFSILICIALSAAFHGFPRIAIVGQVITVIATVVAMPESETYVRCAFYAVPNSTMLLKGCLVAAGASIAFSWGWRLAQFGRTHL